MTSVSPRATMAMVLIERMTPRALVNVKNVLGLLSSVNTMITSAMAITMPPTRSPTARARPDNVTAPGPPRFAAAWFSVIPLSAPCASGGHDVAAVDVDGLASQVCRGVRQHPGHDAGHLLGGRGPLERHELEPLLGELLVGLPPERRDVLEDALLHRRVRDARRDRVHPDPAWREGDREGPRRRLDGRL